jgi:hypothetical protein
MFSTKPETQIEIERLSTILRDLGPGDVVGYDALSGAVGYNVQERRFSLMKAQQATEKETGLRFATVPRQGLKKLPADALPGIGSIARRRIAKSAKRQAARLVGLRYNDIDQAVKAKLDAERSLLGAISAVATTKPETIEEGTRTGPLVAAQVFERIRAA